MELVMVRRHVIENDGERTTEEDTSFFGAIQIFWLLVYVNE